MIDEDFDVSDSSVLSKFEEEMQQKLLISLINEKKAEVFENVVFQGEKRYYLEDLSERDYFLESTTPYQIELNNNIIQEGSWSVLLQKVAKELIKNNPNKLGEILNYKCQWSKQAMFSDNKKTNYKEVCDGLYINCNHTALHACWLLQDLLDFFEINKSDIKFLIRRPSGAEPQKVKDYIEKRFKVNFKEFIIKKYNKDDDYANKVIKIFDNHLNKLLASISKSYVSFYLFDNNTIAYSYIKRVSEKVDTNIKYDEKKKKILKKYLNYINEFYKASIKKWLS